MMMESFNSWLLLVLLLLGLATAIQLIYYSVVFSKLAFYKASPGIASDPEPVSVIIAARNEYAHLEKNLRTILEQDYPAFEVIVVNDCSWDDSQKLLEYYQEVYPHLRICQLIEQEKYPTGKKFALTIGIKAAQYNNLFFTDADCEPASGQWLRLMQSRFEQNKEIVLGYSPAKKYPGLLNLFTRFENVFTATAYFSAAISKNAFMGVGRNLAYTRDLFFKHKGFATHQHILSGDDDLFVNEAATPTNVAIQLDPQSFVYTEPKKTFEGWQRQKTRHITTGRYYKPRHKAFLGAYYASLFVFYAGLLAAALLQADWHALLGVYLLRFVVQTTVMYFIFNRLRQRSLTWSLPLLDLLYLVYLIIFGIGSLFVRRQKVW